MQYKATSSYTASQSETPPLLLYYHQQQLEMESRELQSRSPSETTTATLSSGPSLATSSVLFLPPQESAQSPRFISKAAEWIRGPNPPTDGFKPLFPGLQSWPADTFQRIVKHRSRQILALVVYLLVWLVAFIVVVHYSQFAGSIEGLTPARLSCSTALWYDALSATLRPR